MEIAPFVKRAFAGEADATGEAPQGATGESNGYRQRNRRSRIAEPTRDEQESPYQGGALSDHQLRRISLIVGLVFLHYGRYPNMPISPFSGINVRGFELATFINSFVLFFFFSVVPLLSMVSGWLFFSFREHAATEIGSRIRRRLVSLYMPLVLWNALYVTLLWVLFSVDRGNPVLANLNIDFATARRRNISTLFSL